MCHLKVSPGGHEAPGRRRAGEGREGRSGSRVGATGQSRTGLQEACGGTSRGRSGGLVLVLLSCKLPLDSARKGYFWEFGRKCGKCKKLSIYL